MSLRISGKQMEIGEAFRGRIESRVAELVTKYFDGGYSGRIIVEKTGSRFSADCMIHLDTGVELQTTGTAQEPTLAFDAAAERFEKRLRRYKRRLKGHYSNGSATRGEEINAAYLVVAPVAEENEEVPENYAPAIIAESTVALKTMSVADAVIELDSRDSAVVVFRNAGGHVNVVFRREDGNIGWIDPSSNLAPPQTNDQTLEKNRV